jgi:CubicO group peptidase (beta-lactamase class C family)
MRTHVFLLAVLAGSCQHAAPIPSQQALDALVAPAFSQLSGGVVLVARDDKPLFRRAYGFADVELGVPMRPDHVLGTGSITKQFTAVAILQLAAAGKLALEDDVRKHLPTLQTHGRTITIEQLLTHTSGLANVVDRSDFDLLLRQDRSVEELLALTGDEPLRFEPGTGFYYSDSGYFVLGAIIERVSGMKYAQFLEQNLFRPHGMVDTWYGDERIIPRRARGYSMSDGRLVGAAPLSMTVPYAAGAVFSTAGDLLRWLIALRRGEIIPKSLLDRARAPRRLPGGAISGYGFGWKLCTIAGMATIEHGGFINGYLAQALEVPEARLTIIALANNDGDVPDPGALARRIARFLITGAPELPRLRLDAAQRAALAGRYQIAPGDVRVVSDRDGIMHMQRNDGPARPLAALSPAELALDDGDGAVVYTFEWGANNRARAIRTTLRCELRDTALRVD